MKYLDGYPELDLLSKALSFSSPSLRVSTRIEAYSCKPIARERKLFKAIEHDLLDNLNLTTSISPPEHHSDLVSSAFGPLDRKDSRRTLWLLITTLNIAFPDHDFSNLSAEEFVKEDSPRLVLASLTSALSHLRSSNGQDAPPAMPLNLGIPTSISSSSSALESHHKSYSSSAPSTTHHHPSSSRKAIEQKSAHQPKSSSGSAAGQARASPGKAKANDNSNGKASTSGETTIATATSGANKDSQHQPRAKSKGPSSSNHTNSIVAIGSSSTSSHNNKKKQSQQQQQPITHTTLITKLRNELDGTYEVPTHPLLRQVLDPIIDLSECDVYSYTPDLDSDPHAYQSEDEEEEDDDDDDEDEDEEFERQSADGLDMDLEDEDDGGYYKPAGMMSTSGINKDNNGDDDAGMSWEMEGVESTPATSVPGTPSMGSQSQQQGNASSTFFDAQASPSSNGGQSVSQHQQPQSSQGKKSAQKKRGNVGGSNAGSAKRQSRPSKVASSSSTSSRTRIVPGASIFGDSQQQRRVNNIPFQYGSLDEYSYNHHQASLNQQQSGRRGEQPSSSLSSSRRSPFLEGMSSNDATDNEEDDEEDTDNGGLLWSSNYFFYNKKMKRILFVSVWGRKIGKQFSPSNALLARSSGNPLHAYRKQLHASLGGASGSISNLKSGRKDGRVTINLNRPRAGSGSLALPSSMPSSFGVNDENGSSNNNNSNLPTNGRGKSTTSNLTNALRANAGPTTTTLNTSFSSQPPIANAAAIFKPSSPFPRADNRPSTTAPSTPSNLNPHRSIVGTSNDPQPPAISDSITTNSRQGTPSHSPSAASNSRSAGNSASVRGARRVRQHSSGASTPSRKTAKKNNKRRTGSSAKGSAPGTPIANTGNTES